MNDERGMKNEKAQAKKNDWRRLPFIIPRSSFIVAVWCQRGGMSK
jgi:hypothetical protein